MATIRPFPALRPKQPLAEKICELPYDVMSSEEARQLAKGNPLSFLHVSKPEIDLPPGADLYSPEVYAKGRENFQRLALGALRQDQRACFYLYRQVMGKHSQVGIVAVASCEEYLNGTIKKHELTRPDKEDDRVRHIEALSSQTGPVFLTYRATVGLDSIVNRKLQEPSDLDFVAPDGVRHTSWVFGDGGNIDAVEREFGKVPALYIADGHHRSAAAARVYQAQRSNPNAGWFLAVIFPHNQMQILPYNRVLKDLNGMTPAQLLEKLDGVFVIQKCAPRACAPGVPPGPATTNTGATIGVLAETPARRDAGGTAPQRKHHLGLYLEGAWHTLTFREHFARTSDPIEKLDVTLLQNYVLAPLFGIDDPRTSKRINFVGGIRGTAELEKLVNSGDYACAFSMFPTSIEDLMTIADAGGIMPPKSTWFEPKLRDGMFCHML